MMNLRNGKRLIISDEERNNKKMKNKRAKFTNERPYLPEELILENIVIRLSSRDLAKWSCASKYWYKSILHDPRFAYSHFVHNKCKLNLVFNLLNVSIDDSNTTGYFLGIEDKEKDGFLLNYRFLTEITCTGSRELVGYCNGLVCTKLLSTPTSDRGEICIANPTRNEALGLFHLTPTSTDHLCHGFCFDSLSQKYKVVLIYTSTSAITGDQDFVCMVLTLGGGTNSWRKIVTSTAQISSTSPLSGPMVTTLSMNTRRSATLCGGDLLWRVTNSSDDNMMDMLLSFDIHKEEIRFIRLPTECSLIWTTSITGNNHQCLVVDHHLLEFKGYLCVARSEKIMKRHSCCHPHRHRRHRNNRRSSFCCCGFKVRLFLLKDKVNQVWTKGETFNLQTKEEGLLPAPFCCYFDTTKAAASTANPPARMLSFSDQLLLYWFDGEYLLLYNLQKKYLKVVKCSSSCEKRSRDIFETKMKDGICTARTIGDDDNFNPPYMDYQVHAQAENILSLKTFIPEGETKKFYNYFDLEQSMEDKVPAGLVNTNRELVKFHAFY